ncbi:EamA family transporter [Candidatus Dojkabacteria bacterium]|nr:EamA family transporter [Candidatus Dojkabacteria bacterium]
MWIVYSLFGALSSSINVPAIKRVVDKQDEYVALWAMFAFRLPFAFILILINGIHVVGNMFWGIVLLRVFLDMISGVTEMKAYKYAAISYVVPLMSLSALFSTITGYLINGQTPSIAGFFAIGLITLSTALLFRAEKKINLDKISQKGVARATFYLMITLVLWALTNAIHKEGIDSSDPYTYFFFGYIGLSVGSTIAVFMMSRNALRKALTPKNLRYFLLIGLFGSLDRVFFLTALIDGLTGYVIAIHNTSVILIAATGVIFFKEKISVLKVFSILLGFLGVILFAIGG